MKLYSINDYYKNKLSIPKCEESINLDRAIDTYNKMKRRKKAVTAKNEAELNDASKNIEFHMGLLKDKLMRDGLWK